MKLGAFVVVKEACVVVVGTSVVVVNARVDVEWACAVSSKCLCS